MNETKTDWAGFVAIQNLDSKQYLSSVVFESKDGELQFKSTWSNEILSVFRIDYAVGIVQKFKEHNLNCWLVVDDEQEENEDGEH